MLLPARGSLPHARFGAIDHSLPAALPHCSMSRPACARELLASYPKLPGVTWSYLELELPGVTRSYPELSGVIPVRMCCGRIRSSCPRREARSHSVVPRHSLTVYPAGGPGGPLPLARPLSALLPLPLSDGSPTASAGLAVHAVSEGRELSFGSLFREATDALAEARGAGGARTAMGSSAASAPRKRNRISLA